MTGIEIFEEAIKVFGVADALEYFNTPKEDYYLFADLIDDTIDPLLKAKDIK